MTFYDRTILFNSFWGIEKPISLPPTMHHIGPISPPTSNMLTKLKEKDPALFKWLEDAKSKNEDVVYISIGSIAFWQIWSIEAVYKGLKSIGCKVIWGLKEMFYDQIQHLGMMKDDKFWVRPFLP
jgi:hypothetical protein